MTLSSPTLLEFGSWRSSLHECTSDSAETVLAAHVLLQSTSLILFRALHASRCGLTISPFLLPVPVFYTLLLKLALRKLVPHVIRIDQWPVQLPGVLQYQIPALMTSSLPSFAQPHFLFRDERFAYTWPKLHSLCRLLPNHNRSSTKGTGSKDRACAFEVVKMTVTSFSMTHGIAPSSGA